MTAIRRTAAGASLFVLTLLLAGCGDGGGVASTPTPPPPSYTKVADLSATDHTAHPTGVYIDLRAGGGYFGTSSIVAGGSPFTIDYKAATSTYTFTAANGTISTFGPGDVDASGAISGVPGSYSKTDGVSTFEFFIPTVATIGGVPLTYTALGSWSYFGADKTFIYLGATGSSTVPSDMPKSGTATYSSALSASVAEPSGFGGYNLYTVGSSGRATISANFGAGTITTAVGLVGTPSSGGGTSRDFGTFTGTGTIDSGTPNFSGTFAGTTTSGFSGGFFGPKAAETAYDFYLNTSTFQAIGAVWGKKN